MLVTGAGGGLGGYIARAVGDQGANLVVSDLPGSEIEARAEELGRMGVESHAVPADLTDSAERERLVRRPRRRSACSTCSSTTRVSSREGVHEDHARGDRGDRDGQPDRGFMDLTRLAGRGCSSGAAATSSTSPRSRARSRRSSSPPTPRPSTEWWVSTHLLRAEYADEPVSSRRSALCSSPTSGCARQAYMDTEPPLRPVLPQRRGRRVRGSARGPRRGDRQPRPDPPTGRSLLACAEDDRAPAGQPPTRRYAEDYAPARGRL